MSPFASDFSKTNLTLSPLLTSSSAPQHLWDPALPPQHKARAPHVSFHFRSRPLSCPPTWSLCLVYFLRPCSCPLSPLCHLVNSPSPRGPGLSRCQREKAPQSCTVEGCDGLSLRSMTEPLTHWDVVDCVSASLPWKMHTGPSGEEHVMEVAFV